MVEITAKEPLTSREVSFHSIPKFQTFVPSSVSIYRGDMELSITCGDFDLGQVAITFAALVQHNLSSKERYSNANPAILNDIKDRVTLRKKGTQLKGLTFFNRLKFL